MNPSLNVKTHYSLLQSLIKIDDYIEYAKKNNLKALAIADDNLYGAYEFYKACTSNDIKPIIGLSLDDIVLYAKNEAGYKNLVKIYSTKKLEGNTDDLICVIINKNTDKDYSIFEEVYENIPLNEVRTLNKEDIPLIAVLKAIKEGVTKEFVTQDKNIYSFETNNDTNISKIIDSCNLKINKEKNTIPKVSENSYELLKQKCIEGIRNRFGDKVPNVYRDRLKKELQIISEMGFEDYFLIVSDYINFAKEKGFMATVRGSAAASLVSFVIGITDVDPIKYDLLFERFLNPARKNMPDIDVDFEFDKRKDVIDYCVSKYGKEKVAGIITFGSLSAKQVLRDVCKVYAIEIKTTDYLLKFIDSKKTLKENISTNPKLKEYLKNDDELLKVYQVALKLEGIKKHKSVHAAGIVISDKDLNNVVPIDTHEDINITGYNMNQLEELGLLKMDLLGLKNLSLIRNILEDINDEIDFATINLNDEKTFEIFKTAKTNGIFQFESEGMMNFLSKMKPSTFSDLCAAIALYRPGPMKNIDTYIKRKNHHEKINYFHDDLKPILEETYGIIIYQEQIIKIANTLANYDYGNADVLRRAMAKKDMKLLSSAKGQFVSSSVQNGYSKELAEKIYDHILMFADYGFNKAHSVSYSLVSYKMAYLKANYPLEFYKNILNNSISSESKVKEFLYEARSRGIKVIPPSINSSEDLFSIENESLKCPFSLIKGLNANFVNRLVNNKPYNSIFDLFIKCEFSKKDLDNINKLIHSGSLKEFGYNTNTIIKNLDEIFNYVDIYEEGITSEPEIKRYDDFSEIERLENEFKSFGFYLNDHPVSKFKSSKFVNLNDVSKFYDKNIDVVLYVDYVKVINTKNNKEMAFVDGSDETSSIDLVIFPKTFENIEVDKHNIIKVNARVEKRYDKYQLIANKIDILR